MRRAFCVILCSLLTQGAAARAIHYGAVSHPGLLQCDRLEWTGQHDQATDCYRRLLREAGQPAVLAEAAWALGDLKAANDWFRQAGAEQPADDVIRLRWGDLYTQTYQYQDAMELYGEALERNADNAYARVGAAGVLAGRFDTQAEEYLRPVMIGDLTPPGARLRGMLLYAGMELEQNNPAAAREILEDALELGGAAELPLLEVYALLAAAELLPVTDLGAALADNAWIARALGENPRYGEIYAIPAYYYWITHRYRESVQLYEKAVELDPELWSAHLELGINLLRDNQVTRARRQIEIAYQGDPFNPKAVNTLRLLDTFGDFELINYPEPAPGADLPLLTLRLHRDEHRVLTGYAGRLAEQGIAQFTERYGYRLKEPVIIEIYPNHEDFVVRTTGMPGVGILGATFGYVFAMDSPTAHGEGDYHWGTTLWHELAHVFTLEATRHMIPRWFSEGISVYEEWQSGPVRGVRIPVEVLRAIDDGRLLPVAELDGGFIRETYPGQVQVSYTQAGLTCLFIAREFGPGKLVEMLHGFYDTTATAPVVRRVLEVEPGEFDRRFSSFLKSAYGPVMDRLDDWITAQQGTAAALGESDWPAVIGAAEQAIGIYPDYVEGDSPYIALALAYAGSGDTRRQLDTLEAYWRRGGYEPEALRSLAALLREAGRDTDAAAVLESLNYVIPFDDGLHSALGDLLLELDRAPEALAEYQVLLALSPHDMAGAHYRLARAYHALDRGADARSHLLAALDIAPRYRDAQKLLLEITRNRVTTN